MYRSAGVQGSCKVAVIDDHRTLAELLVLGLNDAPDLECVGHALTAAAGLELVAATSPDVVVMDYRLPDMDGLRATIALIDHFPRLRVVMLTAAGGHLLAAQACSAGAIAVVPKSAGLSELLQTIRQAHQLEPGQNGPADRVPHRSLRGKYSEAPEVTAREREVLELLCLGLDAQRISKRLAISLHTTRGHVKSLLAKFGCHSQLELLAAATRLRQIDRPSMTDAWPSHLSSSG